MSKLNRYNLLSTLLHSEVKPKHILSGNYASDKNEILIQKAIHHLIFLCEDLLCIRSLCDQARNTRLRNLIHLTNDYDFSLITVSLKTSYDILINHISGKEICSSFACFKGMLEAQELCLDGRLFSVIREDIEIVLTSKILVDMGVYKTTSTSSMKCCAAYLLFLSKLNFESVGLEDAALADYLSYEDENSSRVFNSTDPELIALTSIITDWMKDWRYNEKFSYQHGPGSVADSPRAKLYKYLALKSDPLLDYAISHTDDSYKSNSHYLGGTQPLLRRSKLVFVPKNITKLRSISMEPAALQYHQQGVMHCFMNYFHKHKTLRNILHLSDQYWNKSFAYTGSITNDYATIDLSHASDSVCWDLVKQLFKRSPRVLEWLWCTRSSHTLLPNGQTIKLSKFAPMGSALCFPIESIIFAGITKLAIITSRKLGLNKDIDSGISNPLTTFKVYGDDIIVPSYAASTCIDLLEKFGFTPNSNKSYLSGSFKESCGGNYFCGVDITPMKFNPTYEEQYKHKGFIGPRAYTALCSYANMAYESGYTFLRLSCIHQLIDNGIKPLFVDNVDTAPGIFSPTPTNFHLKVKYCGSKKKFLPDYQKTAFLYTGITTLYTGKVCSMALRALLNKVAYFDYWMVTRFKLPTLSNGYDIQNQSFDHDCNYNSDQLRLGVVSYQWCKYDI